MNKKVEIGLVYLLFFIVVMLFTEDMSTIDVKIWHILA